MNIKYVENLIAAKESIKIWFSNFEQLQFGNEMFAKANELDKTKSDFALWYYGEGQTFSSFATFQNLESFYDEMYATFNQYMELRDIPIKKSLFSNEKQKREDLLNEMFLTIKQQKRKLYKSVEIFEENLKTSPLFDQFNLPAPFISEVETKEIDWELLKDESEEIILPEVEILEDIPKFEDSLIESSLLDVVEPEIEDEIKEQFNPNDLETADEDLYNFEKRIQEEVQKLRIQMEEEYLQKIEQFKKESTEYRSIQSEKEKIIGEKDTNIHKPILKINDEIDIAEEIRRILS